MKTTIEKVSLKDLNQATPEQIDVLIEQLNEASYSASFIEKDFDKAMRINKLCADCIDVYMSKMNIC